MSHKPLNEHITADKAKAVLVSLVSAIIVTLLLFLIMLSFVKEQEERRALEILNNVGVVFQDASATLDRVNELTFTQCSNCLLYTSDAADE